MISKLEFQGSKRNDILNHMSLMKYKNQSTLIEFEI